MERNMRRIGRSVGVAAIVLSLSACAGGGGAKKEATAPKIEPEWLARVPPEGMAPVDDARTQRRQQEDEVRRAEVARQDAEGQVEVARNERRAAEARVDAAKSRVKAAKSTGQYTEITEANAALDRAKLAHQVAEANLKRREQGVEVARAREDLEKARLKTADTIVSQAEYRALLASGDTRAAQIDPNRFEQVIARNQAAESQARTKVQRSEQQLQAADARYEELGRQLQASQPAPPAG